MRVQIIKPGCVLTVDDEQAQRLVAQGYATPANSTEQADIPKTLRERLRNKRGCCCDGGCK